MDWIHGAGHMQASHQVTPEEADEADPHSKSGRSVRVIGYSHSRNKILTVILVHREDGGYWGANGWESNSSDRRRYERGE